MSKLIDQTTLAVIETIEKIIEEYDLPRKEVYKIAGKRFMESVNNQLKELGKQKP